MRAREFLLVPLCATGCVPSEVSDTEPILVGVSLPITGDFGEAGTRHLKGYRVCVREINERGGLLGRRVDLRFSDNASDPELSAAQHFELIDDPEIDMLFGTFSTLLGYPASALAHEAGFVYPMPSSAARRVYERGFSNIFYFQQKPAEDYARSPLNALSYYITRSGGVFPSSAGVVWLDDTFGGAVKDGLLGNPAVPIPGSDPPRFFEVHSALSDFGITPENTFTHAFSDPPTETEWQALREGISLAAPEILFAAMSSPEQAVRLVRELRDNTGYQPNALWITQGTQVSFVDELGDAVNGILHQASWHPAIDQPSVLAGRPYSNSQFISAYETDFRDDADEDVAIAFAVCQGMEQAVRATGGTDNEAMAQWLHDRSPEDPVRTIMGEFSWDSRGLPINRDFLMAQWQEQSLEFVYPTDEFAGTVPMLWPKPQW